MTDIFYVTSNYHSYIFGIFTLFCTGAKKTSKNNKRTGWNKAIQDGKAVKN